MNASDPMDALAARQRALVDSLTRPGNADGLKALPGVEGGIERGLNAYRLNARAVATKALASVFPQLLGAFGEADFEAMAWAFWRWAPPAQGDLALWGGRLAEFLAAQEGMDPELCDLARLEWAMHEAERAADVELDAASFSLLGEHEPSALRFVLRPGIALLHRHDGGALLVWRKGWRAASQDLTPGDAAFMSASLAGADLGAALDSAASVDPAFDFSAWLQAALREAWLQAARTIDHKDLETRP